MPDQSPSSQVAMQALWPENLGDSAQVVNQFVVTNDATTAQGVYLLLGQLAPPVFVNEEHARSRMEQANGMVSIVPRGAFYMTREGVEQLRDLLIRHLDKDPEPVSANIETSE